MFSCTPLANIRHFRKARVARIEWAAVGDRASSAPEWWYRFAVRQQVESSHVARPALYLAFSTILAVLVDVNLTINSLVCDRDVFQG